MMLGTVCRIIGLAALLRFVYSLLCLIKNDYNSFSVLKLFSMSMYKMKILLDYVKFDFISFFIQSPGY
jgi:hypothetical protein